MATIYICATWSLTNVRYPEILNSIGHAQGIDSIHDITGRLGTGIPPLQKKDVFYNFNWWQVDGTDTAIQAVENYCVTQNYSFSYSFPISGISDLQSYPGQSDWFSAYPMLGNTNFDVSSLPTEAQVWYERLLNQDVTSLSVYRLASDPGDIETVGEALLYAVLPLLSAFRVTGSLAILDRIDVLMQAAYSSLEDVDQDGYLEWVWRTPTPAFLYLTDNHMATSGISALIYQMAYCYELNKNKTSPSSVNYSDRSDQWRNFALNHFYPDTGLPADNLRHRTIAGIRGMYYNWCLTGDILSWKKFKEYLQYYTISTITRYNGVVANGLQLKEDRYVWDHGTPYPWLAAGSYGWQFTNYAQYTLANIIDLCLEGILPFNTNEITRYVHTAEFVFSEGLDHIKDNVNDHTTGRWNKERLLTWAWPGVGRWSSYIRALGEEVWNLNTSANVITPAWMLVATA